jgi:hypothetical protein
MAKPDAQPDKLQDLLDQIEQAADDAEPVTIEVMLEGAGRRSFGPMILGNL